MASITDSLNEIFLAGIGALAIGAEKSKAAIDELLQKGQISTAQGKQMIDQLVQKGQITVEQGKSMVADLEDSAKSDLSQTRDEIIEAHMKGMTKDERDAFAAKVAEMASRMDGEDALKAQEAAEVAVAAAEEE